MADQKKLQAQVDDVDRAIKGGKFKEQPLEGGYSPAGINIKSALE